MLSNPAAQNAALAFLAVGVGKGSIAYTRDDGVAVIPMAALGRSGFAGVAERRGGRASITENPFVKPDARG